MNATERAALLQGALMFDEMNAAVGERTLEILDRRRKTAVIRRRGWLVRRALLFADVVGLAFAFLLAEMIFPSSGPPTDKLGVRFEYLLFLMTIPAWIVVAKLYRLYERDEERTDHSTVDDMVSVFHLVTVGTWVVLATAWLTHVVHPPLSKLIVFWASAIALVSVSRALSRSWCRRQITYLQNAIIVGEGEVGQLIARKFLHHPEYGINLVGFVDANPRERSTDLSLIVNLGSQDRLPGLVRLFDIERVVIAFTEESHEETLDLIRSLKDLDVQIDIVPRLFEVVGSSVEIHTVEGMPLVGLPRLSLSRSSALLKRTMDVAVSAVVLVFLAPLFALVSWRIKRGSPGPVFFRQVRMGEGERPFSIYKFRTMIEDAEARKSTIAHLNKHLRAGDDPRMFKVENDPRVTKFGAFLRRYCIDELPQLWNVLKGEMSLVGPRPLILDEDQYVDAWGRQRLNLRPGITGPWQVLGGTDIPFAEMVKLDYLYVTSWSVAKDLALMLRTVPLVLRRGGGTA
jgi:exopolysaccharide biosynthesis polyprenyl glycosylphosphotransferase